MVCSTLIQLAALSSALGVLGHPLERRTQQIQLNSTDSYTLIENNGTNSIWPYRKYMTTNATSPVFVTQGQSVVNGSIFLTIADLSTTDPGEYEQGAVIMSTEGDLIWSGPMGTTSNFRKQTFNGEDVITTWAGAGAAAGFGGASHGYGHIDIYNTKYEIIQTVCPTASALNIVFPPGTNSTCVSDVHESYITEDNTMLVTVYNQTRADLTSKGGPVDGYITNSLFVEVDIASSKPLFVWDPLDHVPVSASNNPLNGAGYNSSSVYDWFHMNSIQSFNGGYLINSRQTWSSYFINKQGDIEWELNGKTGGSFGTLPQGYTFSWEHDARLHAIPNDTRILYTVFNDYNGAFPATSPSTGLSLVLDVPVNGTNGTYSLSPRSNLKDANQPLDALAEGSYQLLGSENDTALVSYGVYPYIKEYDLKSATATSNAAPRYIAQFAYANLTANSYRSYKYEWSATPCVPVDVAVMAGKTAFVSWNGATDVQTYAIYVQSNGQGDFQDTGYYAERKGFETSFQVPAELKSVQVVAMADGRELGRSSTVAV